MADVLPDSTPVVANISQPGFNQASFEAQLNLHQRKVRRQRWFGLLWRILQIQLGLTLVSGVFYAILYFSLSQPPVLLYTCGLALAHFILTLLSLGILRLAKSNFETSRWLDVATWLAVISYLIDLPVGTLVLGIHGGILSMFFWPPVLIAILGISNRSVVITTVGSILMLSLSLLSQNLNWVHPIVDAATDFPVINLFLWVVTLLLVMAGLLTFYNQLQEALNVSQRRTAELAVLSDQLSRVNSFGLDLSSSLTTATNELSVTSKQQASGSQEQVAAVTQVTSSLEELSETANQIAASSQAATSAANQTVEIAVRVSDSSEASQTKAEEGRKAVEQTVQSVVQLRNRIELLGQRLLNLTEQNRRVSSIIDLIDEIADETHLLALNASIEAAGTVGGAGEGSAGLMEAGVRQLRSERFGVIAQEIKNLSDRSREATEEVRQAITEMQGAVAAAVLVAEEGKKSTVDALQRAEIAGLVIDNLNEVIAKTAHDFDQVLDATEIVKQRCEEISIATNQQRTANVQIVQTMRNVADVAQQTASSVSQISQTIGDLNQRVGELNAVLNSAHTVIKDNESLPFSDSNGTGSSGGGNSNEANRIGEIGSYKSTPKIAFS